ncbi:MAG: toll/interleukin-1 receptor domain-containing protein [Chitinophagales bacterium]
MDEERIIRTEATYFSNRNLTFSERVRAIEKFKILKERLKDFYSPEYKAIFLNEVQNVVNQKLAERKSTISNQNSETQSLHEEHFEKFLFYIQQELDTLPLLARQKYAGNSEKIRDKVFVSYSLSDKNYLDEIKKHFKPFEDQINFWDNSKILPGQNWKAEIASAIDQTKVIILLVSADFLASDFIISNELPPLLKAAENEGAVILIVILRPCLFEVIDELNQYQTMNPTNKSVLKMDVIEREELYVNLVRQTNRILAGK